MRKKKFNQAKTSSCSSLVLKQKDTVDPNCEKTGGGLADYLKINLCVGWPLGGF
jgi:hypothetical protein